MITTEVTFPKKRWQCVGIDGSKQTPLLPTMSQPAEVNLAKSQPISGKYKSSVKQGNSEQGGSKSTGGTERKYREKDRKSAYSGFAAKHRPPSNDPSALNPHTILLKTRAHEARSLSPVSSSSVSKVTVSSTATSNEPIAGGSASKEVPKGKGPSMIKPVKILNEDLLFQDSFADFLSENPDFLVVGCVGLQWSGKSSILSHLAASDCGTITRQTVFNISTANYQLKGESSSIGLDAFISSERIIWLDCQPLLSAAVAERELSSIYSKDMYKESHSKMETSSCIGTMVEVQSLQLLSFLYCICHVLLVVQDCLADPNLIRLLQTAEMLKPNLSSDDTNVDHMPHLIMLYNRGQPSDLVPEIMEKTLKFHRHAFAKSRLQISSRLVTSRYQQQQQQQQQHKQHGSLAASAWGHHDINFVPLLDWSLCCNGSCVWTPYDQTIPYLKRALLSLPRNSIGPPALTEKTWFSFSSRAWDAVRKSSLMMEYARLLQ